MTRQILESEIYEFARDVQAALTGGSNTVHIAKEGR